MHHASTHATSEAVTAPANASKGADASLPTAASCGVLQLGQETGVLTCMSADHMVLLLLLLLLAFPALCQPRAGHPCEQQPGLEL